MIVDIWPNAACVICKVRRAEPMTFVCKDDKCFQTIMDIHSKGKLKELLSISERTDDSGSAAAID